MENNGQGARGFEFKKFATPRIIGGIVIAVIVLWALSIIFDSPEGPSSARPAEKGGNTAVTAQPSRSAAPAGSGQEGGHVPPPATRTGHQTAAAGPPAQPAKTTHPATSERSAAPQAPSAAPGHAQPQSGGHGVAAKTKTDLPATALVAPMLTPTPRGVAFVEAAVKPLQYELEERWWGWRPNDLIDFTDNVNNFQLGVLEVTRRTAVALADRISRTGTTDSYDVDLDQATNWFMVKATSYWFPSAESKYREGLDNFNAYLEKLKAGKATFYIRADNLIPLLSSFEDLLGSCDENLVRKVHADGSPVGFFVVDDYFYFAQGVASSMATILEAVHHDFLLTLESRNATELLHHAILACERAAAIDPWIVLDSSLSSVFANHRANMAAPISHARFYLGQLIKTLST